MPAWVYVNIDLSVNLGRAVTAITCGHGDVDCLFIGPASIYFPTFPLSLGSILKFYGVDDYWIKGLSMSVDDINKLTIDKMVADIECYRNALGLGKVIVCGPSALGLVAQAYGCKYPQNTEGVLTIGTPFEMRNLFQEGNQFLKDNYTNDFVSTASSLQLYADHAAACVVYDERDRDMAWESTTEQYISELKRDEIKYYRCSETAAQMYRPWASFNIDTRNVFFREILNYNTEYLKHLPVPMLALLGLHDGVVPCYLIADNQCLAPKNFCYYIFENSAHMPQMEDAERFYSVIASWLNKIRYK